mmetsp:Transcript_16614/g.24594  ORF Transcript_16614/g.24594 Transcript_16614/m.24594 type:complete len:509 (-) Transcript_16614:120-1646(-)|eukprot:CAMPEP_0171463120 /NCGR_PEP_ID=MMETSP0945-20130129/6892_1 /TAXON_ID=109269 /ORGANISM="Vaucheria litorea, Strain CCMP2940" /LENGTH=508 /DNA_ID=CAMNT_0011989797 /DNA_START=643 /DNA_END=2169 /DNA_ORIENTATION=+
MDANTNEALGVAFEHSQPQNDQPMVKRLYDDHQNNLSDSETSEAHNIPPEISNRKPYKTKEELLMRKSQSEYPVVGDSSAFINGNRSSNPPMHVYAADTSDIEKTPEPIKSTSRHRHRRSNSLNEVLKVNRSKDAEIIISGAISGGEISSVASRIDIFRNIEAGSPKRENISRINTVGSLVPRNDTLSPNRASGARSVPFSSPMNDSIDHGLVNNKKLQLDEARKLQNLRPQKKEVSVKKIGDWRQRSQVLDTYTLTSELDSARARADSDTSSKVEISSKVESVQSKVKSVPDKNSVSSRGIDNFDEEHPVANLREITISETSENSPIHDEKEQLFLNDEMSAITVPSVKFDHSPVKEIDKIDPEMKNISIVREVSVESLQKDAEIEKPVTPILPTVTAKVEEVKVETKTPSPVVKGNAIEIKVASPAIEKNVPAESAVPIPNEIVAETEHYDKSERAAVQNENNTERTAAVENGDSASIKVAGKVNNDSNENATETAQSKDSCCIIS